MARRGIAVLFAVVGVAFAISVAAFLTLYLLIGREPSVPGNATLTLKVGGELAEVAPTDVVTYLSGSRTLTVGAVVENLRKAQVDDRVRGVLLRPTGFTTPFWGKIQEIRDAVLEFRKSGKPVYAYLEYAGDREYYLATAADRIFLMPTSALGLTGVASYELFLRGTLDKAGVQPDLHHVGRYKTAVNLFTETGLTADHREMSVSLNTDLFDQIVRGIADGRRMDQEDVRTLVDRGPFLPEEAVEAGLVDEIAYEDQVDARLREAAGADPRRSIDGEDYARTSASSFGLDRGPRIAVIYAAGTIAGGRGGYDPLNGPVLGSDTLTEYIRRVRRDSSVRAIVLRIDSPGGSATASDAIWRELVLAKQERSDRPIVASMSDLAASGGYYLAMAADAIVAQPSTLTGSIGIYGGKFVTGGLYSKLGAHLESTSIGRHAEINSPARPYNADELRKVQAQLQHFYDRFIEKVADARGRTPGEIDGVAQGRVWTGRQALEHGLVDSLGGLRQAIGVAKERARIAADAQVEIVVYPPRRSFYELLTEQWQGASGEAAVSRWVARELAPGDRDVLRALRGGPLAMFARGEPLALMPWRFLR
jgi:protease-4